MNVKAINSFTPSVNFGQKRKEKNVNMDYPQMDSPASSASAKALRNAFMAGVMAASAFSVTSCKDAWPHAEAWSNSDAHAWAYCTGCNHKNDTTIIHDTINHTDTVIKTVIEPIYVREYPFNLGDSLIAQGLNIGVELDGPRPGQDDNVIFQASKAHNRYDNKFYETQLDSASTTKNQLGLVTKIVDVYDEQNPKTSYMKTVVTDVPGKGIKLTRYTSNSARKPEEWEWNYAGYEIRTNGRDGKKNTVSVFDNNGSLVLRERGKYLKGENPGTFMYGTVVYNPDGSIYKNENGEPEMAYYDFDKAKMWSDVATYQLVK